MAIPESTSDLTLRTLVARHRGVAAAAAVGIALLVILFLSAVLGPKAGGVVDSTPCAQWGSSSQAEQAAYVQQYLAVHHQLPNGSTGEADVESAINNGCLAAYASDEEDNVTVLDAIKGHY